MECKEITVKLSASTKQFHDLLTNAVERLYFINNPLRADVLMALLMRYDDA